LTHFEFLEITMVATSLVLDTIGDSVHEIEMCQIWIRTMHRLGLFSSCSKAAILKYLAYS